MKSKQQFAIDAKNRKRLLELNPKLNNNSGIYFLVRYDAEGFKYAYIGQAKHILERMVQHLSGYQHIDLSLKKHKLYSDENPYGWKLGFEEYPESKLNEMEQYYIKEYALAGYQLRNKTSGSQGEGKAQIDEYRPTKGYRDGIAQGRKNMAKEIKALFDKHLNVSTKNTPATHYQTVAMAKFKELLSEAEPKKVEEEENEWGTNPYQE